MAADAERLGIHTSTETSARTAAVLLEHTTEKTFCLTNGVNTQTRTLKSLYNSTVI